MLQTGIWDEVSFGTRIDSRNSKRYDRTEHCIKEVHIACISSRDHKRPKGKRDLLPHLGFGIILNLFIILVFNNEWLLNYQDVTVKYIETLTLLAQLALLFLFATSSLFLVETI